MLLALECDGETLALGVRSEEVNNDAGNVGFISQLETLYDVIA